MSKKKKHRFVVQHASEAERAAWARYQAERQAHYWEMWRRQLDRLRHPEDERIRFMRTPGMANALGVGRSASTTQALLVGAAWLDRVRGGWKPSVEKPPPPQNERIAGYLGYRLVDEEPWQLAAARLALAALDPEASLILELTGWQIVSQNDLARAFDDRPNSGWTQQRISERAIAACVTIKDLVARLQSSSPQDTPFVARV